MAIVTISSIITKIRGLINDLKKSDGQNVFEYESDTSFKLSNLRVDSTTITVYVNGTDITSSNWTYNSDTNKVTITSSLTSGDSIIITFSYYEKYSDTEIQNYLESALLYFTTYKYKKRFYINNNEILTDNGINPTRAEGDLIALVSAILINPQNVNIRMPDFSITAIESKSRTEQIEEIFNRANRDFGIIDFMEVEE